MKKTFALILAAGLLPLIGQAQDDPAPAPVTETIAPASCHKPTIPSAVRKADDTSEFDDKFEAYKACIKSYADNQSALAQAHVKAASTAVDELNAFIKAYNEKMANRSP